MSEAEECLATTAPTAKALFANGLAVTLISGGAPGKRRPKHSPNPAPKSQRSCSALSLRQGRSHSPDYCAAVKVALDSKLQGLAELQRQAQDGVPRAPDALSMALRMPRVLKCFRLLTRRKKSYEMRRCFCIWYNTKVVECFEEKYAFELLSVVRIQKIWRGFIVRINIWRRKQRDAKRMISAVGVVNRLCKVYRLRKALKRKIEERERQSLYPSALMLQTVVRLFLGRRAFLSVLKTKLYGELRQWSGGRVDRLLKRPGLQDLETQYLILSAISLATDSLKISISKYGYRLRLVMLKYLRVLRERRALSESAEETMKVESILRKQDRSEMAKEDNLALLISCFDYQTHARERRKLQEHIDALERHRAETAASSDRRAQQLEVSLRKQEAKVERKERELMYLEEYHQRAVDWTIKDIQKKGCALESVLMLKEDQLARSIEDADRAVKYRHDIAHEQAEKVLAAKLEGIRRHGGDGSKLGRGLGERNFAAKSNANDWNTTSSVFSGWQASEIEDISTSERGLNTFSELKKKLAPSLRMHCRFREVADAPMKRDHLLLRVSAVKESRYIELFTQLSVLAQARNRRRDYFRYLQEALAYFERTLARLVHLRHLNRTVKFETKNARQKVLSEAVTLEKRLEILQSDADKYAMKLIAVLKEEMDCFDYLFVKGGPKEFVYAHSPHLFKKKSASAENKAAESWMPQRKKSITGARRVSRVDLRSPSSAKSTPKVNDNSDSWYCVSEEFLDNRMAIDQIDLLYFSSATPLEKVDPPELCNIKLAAIGRSRPDEPLDKPRGKVAGLSKFLYCHVDTYDFFMWSRQVLQWVVNCIKVMSEREAIWRRHFRQQCVCFYQRMVYVTCTELALSTTSSAALLSPYDTSAPQAIDRAGTLELYELLCCRTSIKLTGLDLMSNLPFDLLLNSRDCEIKFGMHPFSMVARFNFISHLYSSGTVAYGDSVSELSADSRLILGDIGARRRVADRVNYHSVAAVASRTLFYKFDNPHSVYLAVQNEYAGMKFLVMELFRHESFNLKKVSVNVTSPIKKTMHAPIKKQSNEANSNSFKESARLNLSIKNTVDITSFLNTVRTNDDFEVHFMPWMCPIHRWGKAADVEPVWRRLGITDVIKMAKSLPKRGDSQSPALSLRKAFSMRFSPQRPTLHSFATKKFRSGPLKGKRGKIKKTTQVTTAQKLKKKKNFYAKRETRLVDFESRVSRWSRNVFNCLVQRVKEKRDIIANASEIEREKQLRVLENDRMEWEDSLARLHLFDMKFETGELSREPPPIPAKNCFSFFSSKKHARIFADYEHFRAVSKCISYHSCVVNRVPDAEAYRMLRYKKFGEEELSINKQLRKQRTLSKLDANKKQGSYECFPGKKKNLLQVENESKRIKRISKKKLTTTEQRKTKKFCSSAEFLNKVFKATETPRKVVVEAINLQTPMISIAEAWMCGGSSVTLMACRVIFDHRRNPRGEIRALLLGCDEMSLMARCGFVTRKMCDDRRDCFAITMTPGRRFLSDTALKRLRGTYPPFRELPTLFALCEGVCESFFKKRFELVGSQNDVLAHLRVFQQICQAKIQRWKLRAIKKAGVLGSVASADDV